MQRAQRQHRERYFALGADAPVERRARAGELAREEAREVRAAASLVVRVRQRRRVGGRGGLGVVPQHRARVAHRAQSVGERVVDAPHERRPAVPQRHAIDAPQRPAAVEALREQPRHFGAQALVVDRLLARRVEHVRSRVEGRIRHPRRAGRHARERRRRPWADTQRSATRAASCALVGAPAPSATTMQVWPATVGLSSARIARSSAVSGITSTYPPIAARRKERAA